MLWPICYVEKNGDIYNIIYASHVNNVFLFH
jgi:hypothetical protein